MPRIDLTSVFVDDQAKALRFYVDVLGFRLKHDIPLGDARWLTVVSPEQGPSCSSNPMATRLSAPTRGAGRRRHPGRVLRRRRCRRRDKAAARRRRALHPGPCLAG